MVRQIIIDRSWARRTDLCYRNPKSWNKRFPWKRLARTSGPHDCDSLFENKVDIQECRAFCLEIRWPSIRWRNGWLGLADRTDQFPPSSDCSDVRSPVSRIAASQTDLPLRHTDAGRGVIEIKYHYQIRQPEFRRSKLLMK